MNIRPYMEKDKENVRHVCIVTAGCTGKPENERQFILKLYCDYYIENEPDNCFVLADDNDEAVGYILCSENFGKYRKNFRPYIKEIARFGFFKSLFARGEVLAHLPASKRCSAHMHIDILPEYQGKRFGNELLTALKNHLKNKRVNGLMLVVGAENKRAVKFYKKNGFVPFLNFGKGILMTLEL